MSIMPEACRCALADISNLRLPSPSELDKNLERLLRTRQRKLTNYQYNSPKRDSRTKRHYPATSVLPSGDALSCVTTLHIYIDNAEDCKRAGMILKHATRVTSLAVKLPDIIKPQEFANSVADDDSMGRIVVENVFRAAYGDRGLLNLTALRFDGMALEHVAKHLQGFVVLEDLRHLQLSFCFFSDLFLEALSQKCSGLEYFALDGGILGRNKHRHKHAMEVFLKATTPKQPATDVRG